MRKPRNSFAIRGDFSIKRHLLRFNRDLDAVVDAIRGVQLDDVWWDHSHSSSDEVMSNMVVMILLLEDRRFFKHFGFEFRIVLRIARQLLTGKRLGGISTIDQQVVRIALKKYDRTFSRKSSEIILAVLLQLRCTKAEILHYYMHNAYLGYRTEGCEMAALQLFQTWSAGLGAKEASLVAAMFARPMPRAARYEIDRLPVRPRSYDEIIYKLKECMPQYSKLIERRARYAQNLASGSARSRLSR